MQPSDSEDESMKREEEAVVQDDDVSLFGKLSIGGGTTPASKRKLVILSLGGLLCERILIRLNQSRIINAGRPFDATYVSFAVYKRPHCERFLKFCMEKFDLAIWSTANRWHTENVLNCVMTGLNRSDLVFVWDQKHCSRTDWEFKTVHNDDKPIFLKQLDKVWDKDWTIANSRYSVSDTLMIELANQPENTLLNPPNTAVYAPAYNFENEEDGVLAPGGELWMFLDGLSRSVEDVGCYVESNPYGAPAITETHPNFAYYQKIILAHNRI